MATNASLGTVGIVRPTQRTAGYEDLLRMLSAGVDVRALCLAARSGLDVDPVSGAEMQALVERLAATPPAVLEVVRKINAAH
jgi:hypothetical protein